VLGLTLAGAEAFPAHGGEGAPVGRAAVLARLEDAVAEARSSGDPLSLVALAVDPWAEEGVLRGGADADRLLRGVGAAIGREPGRGRWVGRVDGDVLLAALPGLDGTSAHAVAERLRLAAAAAAPRGRRRASAGICDATRAGSADQLLTLALSALAWAAAHGRDRTVIYSPETVGRAPDENRSRADGETHPLRRTG
jgi:GGDEF domain-containing protein